MMDSETETHLNRTTFLKIIAAAVIFGFICCPTAQSATFYSASDAGAGPADPRPNSSAMASSFDSAAAGLGAINVINFEDQPVINFVSLTLTPGVTVTLNNTDPGVSAGITTNGEVTLGYNTTSGGNKYLRVVPLIDAGTVSASFAFESPVQAFGTYLTGVGTAEGNLHLIFNDGAEQDLYIGGNSNGGVQFVGFTSAGNLINSVTLELRDLTGDSRDIFGIDDIRYVYIPEPVTLLLFGLGAAILRKRR